MRGAMNVHDDHRVRPTTVGDVMKPHVVTVVPEMTVAELVQTFLEKHVRGAPVLGPTGKVIGVVSETDVLRRVLDAAGADGRREAALDRVRVGEIMGPIGPVFAPLDPITRAAHTFACDRVQRAVVIDNDILLGIVTPADLMPGLDGQP